MPAPVWKQQPWKPQPMFMNCFVYTKEVKDGLLTVLLSKEDERLHFSISHKLRNNRPGRYPTWDEIVEARYRFCPDEITMVMHLPSRNQYVNIHETTFHLWELKE